MVFKDILDDSVHKIREIYSPHAKCLYIVWWDEMSSISTFSIVSQSRNCLFRFGILFLGATVISGLTTSGGVSDGKWCLRVAMFSQSIVEVSFLNMDKCVLNLMGASIGKGIHIFSSSCRLIHIYTTLRKCITHTISAGVGVVSGNYLYIDLQIKGSILSVWAIYIRPMRWIDSFETCTGPHVAQVAQIYLDLDIWLAKGP